MLQYTFEPLEDWPGHSTRPDDREVSRFGTKWAATLIELERELRHLNYRYGTVKLRTFHRPYDVRKDGGLRSDVRSPEHPGVVIAFNRQQGGAVVTMQFTADRFRNWKDNVLAIARAMNALRMVDRYGVSSGRGSESQYEGFRALPPAISLNGANVDDAAFYLSQLSGRAAGNIKTDAETFRQIKRELQMKFHPDKGGSQEQAVKLNLALGAVQRHLGI